MDTDRFRVEPGSRVDLVERHPRDTGDFDGDKEAGKAATHELNLRLEELQELLFAEGKRRVLIILQAMDTGGKDGTIRHVFERTNPQGVRVARFAAPSDVELAHDYLWRHHLAVPGDGEIVIFNRSHYENVLVVRVHGLAPEEVWRRRYRHMNEWERMLTDEGTTILKFFLHISKAEQKLRLESRLAEPHKRWKFALADVEQRKYWDDYQDAYRHMLEKTSTNHSPWWVIPADRKWFRNLAISRILVDTLEGFDMAYPEPEQGFDKIVIPD